MEENEIALEASKAWDELTDEKKKEFFFRIVELSKRFEKQIELYKEQVGAMNLLIVNQENGFEKQIELYKEQLAIQNKMIVNQEGIIANQDKLIANTQKGWDNEKELYAGFLVSIANEIAKGGDMTKLQTELSKFIKWEAGVNRRYADTKFSA